MGQVKNEVKVKFPEGHVWILWDAGEENEYGYEIDVTGEDGIGGVLHTIANWSFGYEDWSHDIWDKWGKYVASRFCAIEGNEEALMKLIDELDAIDCKYTLYHEGESDDENLIDLARIEELIA